jgi:hypothetical protein
MAVSFVPPINYIGFEPWAQKGTKKRVVKHLDIFEHELVKLIRLLPKGAPTAQYFFGLRKSTTSI